MASRPIDAEEREQFGDLTEYKIGLDGVALVANTSNPITNLTTEEVRGIYTGRIINWKIIGGSNARIAPYSLSGNHGTKQVFLEYFGLDSRESGTGEDMIATFRQQGDQAFSSLVVKVKEDHQRVLAEVMTNPGALGYVSLGQALRLIEKGARVRLLNLDNAHPSLTNTQSGAYPFSRPLLVIVKGQPNPALRDFVDFLLGHQGQAIVNRLDYISVYSGAALRAP
jgi:phosphate transport system substrate-binding protein